MAATGDPVLAWKVGMAATLAIGLAKVGLAFGGDWARRVVPRAALLGSIAGVAILLIAFLPMLKILRDPLVGLVALLVLLLGLFGRVRMPLGVPGAFAAVLAGPALFWLRAWLGRGVDAGPPVAVTLALAIPWPTLAWLDALEATLPYLSLALPFALVTIIGGVDNTQSAAAAGGEEPTRGILLAEAGGPGVGGALGGGGPDTPPTCASPAHLTGEAALTHQTLLVLGNGFILTAVVWGWALVTIIERRFAATGLVLAFASVATLFGVIHSPEPSGSLFWPWAPPSAVPARLAGAYGVLAAICWLAATRAGGSADERISA